MILYRITKPAFAQPFSGEGARRYGGRWNPKGTAMVYYASTAALAMLEVRVHTPASALMVKWTMMIIDVPDACLSRFEKSRLPNGWRNEASRAELQKIGKEWAESGRSLGLLIPSIVSPSDQNVLLNPLHPDLPQATLSKSQDFSFDERLAL